MRRSFLCGMWIGLFVAITMTSAPVARCEGPMATPAQLEAALKTAARIDEHLAKRITAAGMQPALLANDDEFVRRVYLDLHGIIPRVGDVREFRNDSRADKRQQLIENLLASPRHATHLANTWRQFMLPGNVDLEDLQSVAGIQNWLRRQFAQNLRYDRIVSDFLVASGGGDAGPALYYTSLELKPEKVAASTARIFLGLHLECAQCHKHPIDKWTQEDFWSYAAFFAQLEQGRAMGRPGAVQLLDKTEGEVKLPDTETVVPPRYPDGNVPVAAQGGSRRVQLAIWMASRDNPYLARAVVNRVWAHLFGRGLVEPVDDISDHNPASHPELFRELTDYFISTGYDLRQLIRTLTYTQAYQRTSRSSADKPPPPELFAQMAVKTLTSEELYDCLNSVLMQQANEGATFLPAARGVFDPRRLAFAAQMQTRGQNATEYEAGVLQALTLLNGNHIDAATHLERSALLTGLDSPLFNDEQRVEMLFLATLCRPPTDAQRSKFVDYVSRGGAKGDVREALSDVLWALLNSAEFGMNH